VAQPDEFGKAKAKQSKEKHSKVKKQSTKSLWWSWSLQEQDVSERIVTVAATRGSVDWSPGGSRGFWKSLVRMANGQGNETAQSQEGHDRRGAIA
jgi:hypothetical protein